MGTPLVTASRDALIRELERHIGAHASIVANDLLASGVVRDPATLADDEALVERVNFAGPRQLFSGTAPEEIRDVLTNLVAALTEDPA